MLSTCTVHAGAVITYDGDACPICTNYLPIQALAAFRIRVDALAAELVSGSAQEPAAPSAERHEVKADLLRLVERIPGDLVHSALTIAGLPPDLDIRRTKVATSRLVALREALCERLEAPAPAPADDDDDGSDADNGQSEIPF